jgi:hypothetical protein
MRRLSERVSSCVRPLLIKDCMISGFSNFFLESGLKRSTTFSSAILKVKIRMLSYIIYK